ncbi:MAG: AsmA family protein, partial [Pseudomonadota bacterium]
GLVSIADAIAIKNGDLDVSSQNTGAFASTFLGDAIAGLGALETVSLSATFDGPLDALSISNLVADHKGDLFTASYRGAANLGGAGRLNGAIAAKSDDLRGLLSELGTELPAGDTLKTISFEAGASGVFSSIDLKSVALQLDDLNATGDLNVNTSGPRTKISGVLNADTLDLTPFMGASGDSASTSRAWSDAPFDFSGLRFIDLNVDLTAESIVMSGITFSDAQGSAVLSEGGKFEGEGFKFKAFGGNWTGDMGLDARAATPRLNARLTGGAVRVSDFVNGFTGFDPVSGIGQVSLNIASKGASPKAIVESLTGAAEARIENGSLKGVNAAAIVRSAQTFLSDGGGPLTLSPAEETDFTSLRTQFDLQSGVARLTNFAMDSPFADASGSGRINLGGQLLDLRIQFKQLGSAASLGGAIDLSGLDVPVRFSGDWLSPSVSLDTEALQAQFLQQTQNKLTQRLTESIGLKPGSSDENGASSPEDEIEALARGALGGLLGRRRDRQDDEDED